MFSGRKYEVGIFSNSKQDIIQFFAILNSRLSDKKFVVSGLSEDLDHTVECLKYISSRIISGTSGDTSRRFFRFSNGLTIENAQDYGYIRGLLTGIVLMLIDTIPWHIGSFRPQGVLSTFLEYTRIVYYGTPGFAIVVGMAAIGIYFTILFILIPIMVGNLFVMKAKRLNGILFFQCLILFLNMNMEGMPSYP